MRSFFGVVKQSHRHDKDRINATGLAGFSRTSSPHFTEECRGHLYLMDFFMFLFNLDSFEVIGVQ